MCFLFRPYYGLPPTPPYPSSPSRSLPNPPQADESPEGQAQRLRQEQEKARRRAEKLGILLDSNFEVAAGTAAANTSQGRGTGKGESRSSASPANSPTAPVAKTEETATGGERQAEEGEEVEGREGEEEEERARRLKQEEEEEEERRARAALKEKPLYGQEMSAIAMGHPEAAQGPGKVMSMGSSSYVVDMVSERQGGGLSDECCVCALVLPVSLQVSGASQLERTCICCAR